MSAKKTKPTRGSKTTTAADKKTARAASPPPVRFQYRNGCARKVCLAGSFNDWRPDSTEMISLSDGKWAKNLALPPGTYEYRLVVDGLWMADPGASENTSNPYGGQNSIIVVKAPATPSSLRRLAASTDTR